MGGWCAKVGCKLGGVLMENGGAGEDTAQSTNEVWVGAGAGVRVLLDSWVCLCR